MCIMYYLHEMGDIATGNFDRSKDVPKALSMCFGLIPLMIVYSIANLGKEYCCNEMASKTKARLAALIAEHCLLSASTDPSERSIALSLASSETNQVQHHAPLFAFCECRVCILLASNTDCAGVRGRAQHPFAVGLCPRSYRHQHLVFNAGCWSWVIWRHRLRLMHRRSSVDSVDFRSHEEGAVSCCKLGVKANRNLCGVRGACFPQLKCVTV